MTPQILAHIKTTRRLRRRVVFCIFDFRIYAKYILKEGANEEKRELMGCFKSKLKITEGMVTIAAI